MPVGDIFWGILLLLLCFMNFLFALPGGLPLPLGETAELELLGDVRGCLGSVSSDATEGVSPFLCLRPPRVRFREELGDSIV